MTTSAEAKLIWAVIAYENRFSGEAFRKSPEGKEVVRQISSWKKNLSSTPPDPSSAAREAVRDQLSVSLNKALKEKFALMRILSEADEWIQIRKDFTNSFINTEYAEGLVALAARLAALGQEKS